MRISKHKVVSIDYTLTNDAGQIIDQSSQQEPFAYIHGMGSIIPGLEQELEGKIEGDSLTVRIPPEMGYGERNDALVHVLDRGQFQGVDTLEVGMQFHAGGGEGGMQVVTVTAIDGDAITIDANHPLAGTPLNFEVTVLEVRDATAAELDHGHVHGAGGHHH